MEVDKDSDTKAAETFETSRQSSSPEVAGLSGFDLLRFRCLRNAAYHDDRERHFAAFHKAMMFLVVLFGMIAFGLEMSVDNLNPYAPIATLISATAGIVDLVFDLDGRARLHVGLKRRFFDLLARLEKGEKLARIEEEITRSYPDEPPTMHAVNSMAFNAAVDGLGRPTGQKYVLTPWQILIRHWWPFEPNSFPTEDEARRADQLKA